MIDPATGKQIIWQATLDQIWQCLVVREDDRTGTLIMRDQEGKEILRQSTGLSYGAEFGPDVSDVEEWSDICEARVR